MNRGMRESIVSDVLIDGKMWKFVHKKWNICCELIIMNTDVSIELYLCDIVLFHMSFTHPLFMLSFAMDCENKIKERYWYGGLRFLPVLVMFEVTFGEYNWDMDIWDQGFYRSVI